MTVKRKSTATFAKKNTKAFVRQTFTTQKMVPARYAIPPKKVELKYDDGITNNLIPSGGLVVLMTTIANGTGPSERIGRHIAYSDLTMNYEVGSVATAGSHWRASLIFDKQTNAATPAITDIFNGVDSYSLMNPDNRSRFTLLSQTKGFFARNVAAGYAESRNTFGSFSVSLKGKKCEFLGSTAAIADIDSGAIFLVLQVDSVGSNNIVTFNERNRLQYFD